MSSCEWDGGVTAEVAREMARDQVARRLSHATGLRQAIDLANRVIAEHGTSEQDSGATSV